MKSLNIFFILVFGIIFYPISLFSEIYYAKIEPIDSFLIKASVSGKVEFSKKEFEGKYVKNETIVKIDDAINRIDLESSIKKLELYEQNLKINDQIIENLTYNLKIKEENFSKLSDMKTKAKIEKDNEYAAILSAKNQILTTKQSSINLQNQIEDIKYKIATLKDQIGKKNIKVENLYIYKVYVEKDDFVNAGSNIIEAFDTTKGKLTIFVSKEDINHINEKNIFINEAENNHIRINKIFTIADKENISSYKVEILIDSPKIFSQLVKVEIK